MLKWRFKSVDSHSDDETLRAAESIQLNQKTLDGIISRVASKLKDLAAMFMMEKLGESSTSSGEPKRVRW